MIFVGIDWSERHHDVCVVDADGTQLARGRVRDGIEGVAELHGILATHAEEPEEVIVGIETDRGLLVGPWSLLNHITLDGHAAAGAARQRRLRWEPVSASTVSAIESAEPRQPVLHAHRQTRARRRKRPRPAPL